jgi:spore coat protein cotH
VNFYTWNSGGEAFKWPGQEMTYVGNNIFKAVLPAGYDRVLYNNGEGQQTYDLNAPDLEDKIHIAMEHSGGGKYNCAAVAYHPNTAVTVLVGDADENGTVNLSDVLSMQKHLARIKTLAGSGLTAADINNDGDVNMADVLLVMQYLARYSNDYDIGQPRQTSVWS